MEDIEEDQKDQIQEIQVCLKEDQDQDQDHNLLIEEEKIEDLLIIQILDHQKEKEVFEDNQTQKVNLQKKGKLEVKPDNMTDLIHLPTIKEEWGAETIRADLNLNLL
jgi:hypothetical protein